MSTKSLLVAVLIGSAICQDIPSQTGDFQCQKVDGKFQEGYFPNPASCTDYFICDSTGKAYTADCGDYGSFDPDSQSCKLSHEVKCSLGIRGNELGAKEVVEDAVGDVKEETVTATTTTEASVKKTTTTNASLTTATTEEPEKEENSAEATVEPTTPVTEEPEIAEEDGAKGDIPEEDLYDYYSTLTEEEALEKYGIKPFYEEELYETPLFDRKACEDLDDGRYLVHDTQCSRYYECQGGKSTHLVQSLECPSFTTFDEEHQECVHIHRNSDVRCPGSPSNIKATRDKAGKVEYDEKHLLLDYDEFEIPEDKIKEKEAEEFCMKPENQGKQMTIDKACHKFRVCEGELGVRIYDCPPYTTFDDQAGDCVTFGTTTRKECKEEQSDLVETKHSFKCPSQDDLGDVVEERIERTGESAFATFPHPEDCGRFFICYIGRESLPKLVACTKPAVFDPVESRCRHFSVVKECKNYYD